ncbi:unnamed protein product [Medioppia subpectinata]|uniref:Terpene synthase n=1 Tax=Medioppia subpectinata TaxID=1979941 RepID=A0A7R9KLG1_9ACAR|nr:unnamed protein product [Medioppia subpectinata]CAG2105437.1 unnamed protein product [Medioppia subpectinata]
MNHNETNKPGRKYPLPAEAVTVLPYHYNQIHARIDAQSRQWLLESSLFTPEQYNRLANTGLYTAYFYPFITDEDRYDVLNRQMINFNIIDDHLETPYGDIDRQAAKASPILDQLYQVYAKLLAGPQGEHVSAHHWKPYVLGSYAIQEHIFSALNDVQRRRFIQLWTEWTDSMMTECLDLNNKKEYGHLDEFYEVRRISVAFLPIYHMCEYAHNLFVPEDEWHNPRLQRLFKVLSKAGVMCNDIYSFEKEVLDAGGRVDGAYNGVSVLVRMHGIPVVDAMRQLANMCRELELEAQELVGEIQSAHWASADTRDYVQRLLWINGGNWKVCTILDRYNTMNDITMPDEFQL